MQHFSENYWKKRLAKTVFPGDRENGPKKGEWGKRENEIECRDKGKGKAPDLKSEPRYSKKQDKHELFIAPLANPETFEDAVRWLVCRDFACTRIETCRKARSQSRRRI